MGGSLDAHVPRETYYPPHAVGVVLTLRPGEELSTIPSVLDATRLRQLLEPFGLDPSPAQTDQILAYLHLLLRWNQKINLTAIRDPEECVTRHFGESLFLAQHAPLRANCLTSAVAPASPAWP